MHPLWLALHLPCLALEASAPLPSPSAVVEQGRVVLGDAAARQAGIASGSGVAAARMLLPTIALIARNPAREAAALHTLACWAGSLTPRVSLTSDGLLLEIGSCLRLFGGLEQLIAAAQAGLRAQNFTVMHAVAPTPTAAHWLARTGSAALCRDRQEMHRQLAGLPIAVLPAPTSLALARFGARSLADVRGLPSAALARRIGAEALQLIARAFGELPDPRADFVFPERFAMPLELPAAVDNAAALLFAARRLTAALAGWLTTRRAGLREFSLRLRHRQSETALVVQFAEATAEGARFERVLRERLHHLTLRAPVEALRLEATQIALLPGRSQALFKEAGAAEDGIGALLERLGARLGEGQVYRVALHADHRPEHASGRAHCGSTGSPRTALDSPRTTPVRPELVEGHERYGSATALPRPLWLLDPPQSLAEVAGRPYRRGHLKLLAGPERIEAGWWDVEFSDIRRDYFVALAADASWLWIYRDCRAPGGWFLHGIFS